MVRSPKRKRVVGEVVGCQMTKLPPMFYLRLQSVISVLPTEIPRDLDL